MLHHLMKIHKKYCHESFSLVSNMHQIVCRLGLYPRPHWETLQRFPNTLAALRGPTSKGKGNRGEEGERGVEVRKEREG